MNNEHQSYRDLLQDLSVKSQEQYDKTVITLSTGALGLSFAFIKDVVDIKTASNINKHSKYYYNNSKLVFLVFFIVGLVFIIVFVKLNLRGSI